MSSFRPRTSQGAAVPPGIVGRGIYRSGVGMDLKQPKGIRPAYHKNIMVVPLGWGHAGQYNPRAIVEHLVPLFRDSINRTSYVFDPRRTFERLVDLREMEKALAQAIESHYHENAALTSEYFEGVEDGKSPEIDRAWAAFKAVEGLRVRLTPIVSPTSGVPGLRVQFSVSPP